ncbi:phospholipid phosphatase 5 [Dendroctonus ponderosae]|uniref:Phosphatidic acid phosphatase type 2/haloperoxidase domain-containing protein n=1 Tax=Dendroctonus ponderosae TaxID=77166 RepID=U4U2I9_DENPD|nr:phospholipid phosphatase 5 [Dendroctonus ponderosae]ERL84811.1 hypothetical protein D910_02235 [Dendroctonus ponderosae]KAH1012999.1 hypothetical protein HUJ05_012057 [Dendroctonus ponderosae]
MDVADHVSEVSLRAVLYMIFMWLDKQTPFIRHIEEEELWMYRYPSIPSIVPKWGLYILLVLIPAILFLIEYAVNQRLKDIIKGFYALTLVYMINGIFTVMLKLLVGRPRPNFFMRCFPDGYGTDINHCTGEYRGHMDGRKSFPSAHATFAFSGMFFMTLRMCRILQIKDPGRHKGWKCLTVIIPVIFAVLIGVSRTCDYHHHYSDVLFGAIMGMGISYFVYYAYYWAEGMSPDEIRKSLANFY